MMRFVPAFVLPLLLPLTVASAAARGQTVATNATAAALKTFTDRVDEYVSLHKRLESKLPSLGDEAAPEEIAAHARALRDLIQAERRWARQGDIFVPEVQDELRRLWAAVVDGADGQKVEAQLLDEQPEKVTLVVNGEYPEEAPVATIPPQVLLNLPRLPEDVEYRLVGRTLILHDAHAGLIVDFMPDVLPAT